MTETRNWVSRDQDRAQREHLVYAQRKESLRKMHQDMKKSDVKGGKEKVKEDARRSGIQKFQ